MSVNCFAGSHLRHKRVDFVLLRLYIFMLERIDIVQADETDQYGVTLHSQRAPPPPPLLRSNAA